MSIYLQNGVILVRDGSIGTSEDCCCDDPCISCNPCPTCWTSDSERCTEIGSVDVSVSGITTTYSSCDCAGSNATYTLDISTYQCSQHIWYPINECPGPISPIFGVPGLYYTLAVIVKWNFRTTDLPLTTQTQLTSSGLQGVTSTSKLCNAYTLYAGHYVSVEIRTILRSINPLFGTQRMSYFFLYGYNNEDIKAGCPDDQSYGLCSGLGSGGTATHVWSDKSGVFGTPNCFDDFGYSNIACTMNSVSVSVSAPLLVP